ncbi:MAG: hypothetical protein KC492_02675, partial [Myxococcales bacterium]|nr:hypothetical protein [Myxococcales bacterium]
MEYARAGSRPSWPGGGTRRGGGDRRCQDGKSCSGNNPTSPYSTYYVPRAPGQTVANPNELPDGTSSTFRLREDEAVIYVGKTPPPAKYFGFRSYLFDRFNTTSNQRENIFASLGPTLNPLTIGVDTSGGTGSSPAPFDRPTLVITTGHAQTDRLIRESALAAGISESALNTDVLDPAKVKFGLEDQADSFGFLFRYAIPEDPAKGQAFLDNPGATLLRVTPTTPLTPDPIPAPARPTRGSGTSENSYSAALDALEQAIRNQYSGYDITAIPLATTGEPDPDACIAGTRSCAGDNPDALYPSSGPLRFEAALQPNANTFYVAFGVNHEASGKVLYSNLSVYGVEHLVGVKSVASPEMPGSAQDYLPNDAQANELFAWKIARSCGGAAHCMEVPTGCPGVDTNAFATITFRAYLDPVTKTGPAANELLPERILKISNP